MRELYCEFCPGQGEMCDECLRDYLEHRKRQEHTSDPDEPRRVQFSVRVLIVCLVGMAVITAFALVYAVVRTIPHGG